MCDNCFAAHAEQRQRRKVMKRELIPIICPNCNSCEVNVADDGFAVCNSCGSRFVVSDDETTRNVYVTNQISIDANGQENGGNNVTHVNCTVEEQTSVQRFVRNACLSLARDIKTPRDVFDSSFKRIETEIEQFLCVEADVTTTYSASVGYDRKVERVDVRNGRTVTRTETVTDWTPFSGEKKGTELGVVPLKTTSCNPMLQASRFAYWCNTEGRLMPLQDGKFAETPVTADKENYAAAMRSAEEALESDCASRLPGDRAERFQASSVSKPCGRSATVLVPTYVMRYEYKGEKFEKRQFACSKEYVDYYGAPSDKENAEKHLTAKIKPWRIAGYAIFSAALLLAIIFLCLGNIAPTAARLSLMLPLTLASIALFVVNLKYPNKCVCQYAKNLQAEKLSGLEKLFRRNKFKDLTEEEKNSVLNADVSSMKFKTETSFFAKNTKFTILFAVSVFFSLGSMIFGF